MVERTVLIVEDNAIVAFSLQRSLIRSGYTVVGVVTSGEQALAAVAAQGPDLVLMDVGLAGKLDGFTTAEHIQSMAPIPIIYLTGQAQDTRLENALCLSKPVIWPELLTLMEQIFQ